MSELPCPLGPLSKPKSSLLSPKDISTFGFVPVARKISSDLLSEKARGRGSLIIFKPALFTCNYLLKVRQVGLGNMYSWSQVHRLTAFPGQSFRIWCESDTIREPGRAGVATETSCFHSDINLLTHRIHGPPLYVRKLTL